MTAATVTLRDEVYTRVLLKRTNADYVFNNFDVEKTWFPYERLEDLTEDHPNGKVYIIGLAPGDADNRTRSKLSLREHKIMVGYQRAGVDPTNNTLINDLVELVEQLDRTLIHQTDTDLFHFTRLEYIRDENDIPFSFMGLRTANVFEAYFTAHFNFVLDPNTAA